MAARPYLWGLVLVACRAEELPCARIGELCTGETWYRGVATVVDDAVAVDVDGDGEDEIVALTADSHLLALGYRDGTRSVVWLKERPVALAGLGSEVAVALAEGPGVAIFGADGEGRLERRRDLAVKYDASDLWSGELDGDGGTELVVAHPNGRLTVLAAESGAGREISIGGTLTAVEVADLDADGIEDVVVADPERSAVHVLRGAGGGELHPARKFLAIEHIDGLALADGDGDGDVDVLTRNLARPGVIVLHNNGKGELSLPLELEFTGPLPTGRGLAVGPTSAEGLAGLIVPQGKRLAMWLREGTGWFGHVEDYLFESGTWISGTASELLVGGEGFVERFRYQASATPIEVWRDTSIVGDYGDSALALGDLDGDGALDLVAAVGTTLRVLRGTANGFVKIADVPIEISPEMMIVAEVTGDLRPDIVVSDRAAVRVVQTGADGSFTPRAVHVPATAPLALTPLRRGPGAGDLVAIVPNSEYNLFDEPVSGIAILRYDGDGAVAEETAQVESLAVLGLLGIDGDGDGVDEPLMFARRGEASRLARLMPSPGGFEPAQEVDLSGLVEMTPEAGLFVHLAPGDTDKDGALEVWIMRDGTYPIRVSELAAEPPAVEVVEALVFGTHLRDVDGDGHVDVVRVGYSDFNYQRGRGDDTFDEEMLRYNIPGNAVIALPLAPGGAFDVATLSYAGVATHRLRNVVRPVHAGEDFGFHAWATELVVADLDADGYDDVVTCSDRWSGGVQVLWGDLTGSLARADGFDGRLENSGLTLGDIDGDGAVEVLVANSISSVIAYRFMPSAEEVRMTLWGLNSLEEVQDIDVADIDGDGHPDVLALAYAQFQGEIGMRLSVVYGEGGDEILEFGDWAEVTFIDGREEARLEVGDVDGDGMVDLLVRSPSPDGGWHGLLFAEGTRAWSEPVEVPGKAALFMPRGDDGRVELLVHDGETIVRHPDGELERRETLLRRQDLADGTLQRVADVDGDGRGDLLVRGPRGTDLWLRGDDGYQRATTVDDMQTVEVGDVDGDGRPDLVGLVNGTVAVRLAAKRD